MAKTEITESPETSMSRPRVIFSAMRNGVERMFERTLRLPDTIDDSQVEARFDKGVLTITAPKRPEAVKTERKIEIRKNG